MKKHKILCNKTINLQLVFCSLFILISLIFSSQSYAQDYNLVSINGVLSGNETNNTMFKATSYTIPSLAYVRAQRIEGPQNGFFTQSHDNIRYTSTSKIEGMPNNKCRIRFTFLKADKRTPIELSDFRFIINDIDGPSNESLATNCRAGVRFIGTAQKTNLIIDNEPPDLNAVGSVDENEGPTSRVMFEFEQVSMVEFDNYANLGYFKDFDMNDDYPMATPLLVECVDPEVEEKLEFKSNGKEVLIETNPIYFDLDSYLITDRAAVELQKVVDILNKYPDLVIEVRSHTDARADDDYNIKLSNRRAIFTVNWIVNHGINPSRINARGYGETQLINKCSNNVECSEEEHQLNRRTEFVIINKLVLNNI